jgi:hypothetical protein
MTAIPGRLSDQNLIIAKLDSAANYASGLGEHGIANQLWALSAKVRRCAAAGHRYVRGADPCGEIAAESGPSTSTA